MTRQTRVPTLQPRRGHVGRRLGASAAFIALALAVAACNLFSNPSGPTASPSFGPSPTDGATATARTTPAPTPQLVKNVTLVAAVAEPRDATPSGLTWKGVQDAGTKVGAAASLVEPASNADLPSAVDKAAASDLAVVVTIGPDADPAVQAAAVAHPGAQFFEMGVAVPTASPPNVHGIVFDEAEAGYLAGFVAGSFSAAGKIGFVGDTATDARSANYASGFGNGAFQARTGIGVSVVYVGTSDSPDKGRTTAAGLVKAGVDVVSALPDLSGIGALREACGRKARLVAVDTDAWQTIPDVRSCLVTSVLKRYDVAVGGAIERLAAGQTAPATIVEDVSTGGIDVGDFHVDQPAGFDSQLASVVAALKRGPPRPTAAPSASSPSTSPGSPTPSPT
jgi:basic membrane protein A